jgi:hypothetical protein
MSPLVAPHRCRPALLVRVLRTCRFAVAGSITSGCNSSCKAVDGVHIFGFGGTVRAGARVRIDRLVDRALAVYPGPIESSDSLIWHAASPGGLNVCSDSIGANNGHDAIHARALAAYIEAARPELVVAMARRMRLLQILNRRPRAPVPVSAAADVSAS